MIFNDHEFIFPDGESNGTGFQGLPLSPNHPYSDISSSSFLVSSVDRNVRPRSAPPCPLPGDTGPLSDPDPVSEASLRHATPMSTSRIRFIDENHSVCSGQDPKDDESKHIPRPPNAFMLYRSDFLKKGVIPPEVEKRQQNLSRIAGQCWNMLSDSEKAIWHDKAAAIQAAHYAKYPSYKFRPSRKEARRLAAKEKGASRLVDRGKAFIRSLREEYAGVAGHSSGPVISSRASRTHPYKSPHRESMFAALHDSVLSSNPSPDSLSSTPLESPASASSSLSPLSPLSLPTLLPPFTSLAHSCDSDSSPVVSQSLITRRHKTNCQLDSPAIETSHEGLTDMIRDLEITPSVVSPSQIPHPMLHPAYQDSFGSYVPSLGLGQSPDDSLFQVHPAFPELTPCSSLSYRAGDIHLQPSDLHVMHNFALCNPSAVSWYPWSPNTENSSDGLSGAWLTQGRL